MNQHRGHLLNKPKVQRKKLFVTAVAKKDTIPTYVQRKVILHQINGPSKLVPSTLESQTSSNMVEVQMRITIPMMEDGLGTDYNMMWQ